MRLQRHFTRPRSLALQLQADFPVRKSRQPPFKNLRLAHRLAGRNLRQPPRKALEIRRPFQRPVQPRRTDLQNISPSGNQFLSFEDLAQLLADSPRISVADFGIRLICDSPLPSTLDS